VLLPFPDTPATSSTITGSPSPHWRPASSRYVDRPLYDYVQHAGAVFGDVTHGAQLRHDRAPGRARGAYFLGYLAREAQAQVLLARCGHRLATAKRRDLNRFVACDRSPAALGWLAARSARTLTGRTETLASESELAEGVLWKQLAVAFRRSPHGPFADASIPPLESFTQKRLRRWRASI